MIHARGDANWVNQMSSVDGSRRSSVQHVVVKTPDYAGRSKPVHPSSAGKKGVLHHGCLDRTTVSQCSWFKHGTRTKLHGGRLPKKWRRRWVSKTHSSTSCPVRRLLEPSKAQMMILPHPLTTHKVDYARITDVVGPSTPHINSSMARSGPFFLPQADQQNKNVEFPTQRRGLKHQTCLFLLRTSLNVVLDQGT